MRLADSLANAFINTFGITQPTEQARRRASWFIVGLLILALIVVVTVGSLMYQALHH